jgi:hypothetical protein
MTQRQSIDTWAPVFSNVILLAGGIAIPFLAYPAVRLAYTQRQIRFWTWIAVTVAGPILVFFNLYVVHDYYAIAVSGSVAALVGLGVAGLTYVRTWLRAVLVAGAAIAWAAVWVLHVPYWTPMFDAASDPEGVLPLAEQIERETNPDQLVAIFGRDWTPEVLYYAHRWGWMINGHESTPVKLETLWSLGYVIYQCPWVASADHCTRIEPAAEGVPVPDATIGPVTRRTGLLESRR